jgi:hypothetical protein
VIRGTFAHPRKFYPDIVRGARRQQLLGEQHEEDDRACDLSFSARSRRYSGCDEERSAAVHRRVQRRRLLSHRSVL